MQRERTSSKLSEVSESSLSSEETKKVNKTAHRVTQRNLPTTDMKVFRNKTITSKRFKKKVKLNKIKFNIRNNIASPILRQRFIKCT